MLRESQRVVESFSPPLWPQMKMGYLAKFLGLASVSANLLQGFSDG